MERESCYSHIIYVSTNKAWRYNSRFGEAFRRHQHKAVQITRIACVLNYLTPSDNRQTLRDILTEDDKGAFKCVAHSLGIQCPTHQNTPQNAAIMNIERRYPLFRE